jgi:hypothetical protein
MSASPLEQSYSAGADPNPRRLPQIGLASGRILFWGAIQFCLSLMEQVAELLAPMLFVAGIAWWAVLRVVGSVQLDDGSPVQKFIQHIPAALVLSSHHLTPGRLIRDGLLLMALVAACRTIGDIIAKET